MGIGAVGTTLAKALARAGYQITALIDIQPSAARKLAEELSLQEFAPAISNLTDKTGLLIIAVPDSRLTVVDKQIANELPPLDLKGCVHTSGAISGSILQNVRRRRILTGSLHPLQSFTIHSSPSLDGVFFAIEGSGLLQELLEEIVLKIGGIPIKIPEDGKPLYHAAAVFASNFIPVMLRAAVEILTELGIPVDEARGMLAPLMMQTLHNCIESGETNALTGPVSRGDEVTIEKHLHDIGRVTPTLLPIYRMLSLKALELAAEKGLDDRKMAELIKVLNVVD
jgi:predicted short-subunit dehydrogenase-like oxidoreductase (DUF2520 family)